MRWTSTWTRARTSGCRCPDLDFLGKVVGFDVLIALERDAVHERVLGDRDKDGAAFELDVDVAVKAGGE